MQGVGIKQRPHSVQNRQECSARQAKRMEHRQGVQDPVGRVEVDPRRHLSAVGQEVAVAQRHALGRAFRSGGEEDRRGLVRIAGGPS